MNHAGLYGETLNRARLFDAGSGSSWAWVFSYSPACILTRRGRAITLRTRRALSRRPSGFFYAVGPEHPISIVDSLSPPGLIPGGFLCA